MAVQKTDAFDLEGFVEQKKQLEALLMSNPKMEKRVQGLIKKVLIVAKKSIGEAAENAMKADPRQASKAVRMLVYKQILGGNVNILSKKRASNKGGHYEPTKTLRTGQRGGNRRSRSARTRDIESYFGADRGFILRFLNAGTDNRAIEFKEDSAREHIHRGSRGGNRSKYGKTINTGFRGRITPRNFFANSSHRAMAVAAEQLTQYIDELIKQEFKN